MIHFQRLSFRRPSPVCHIQIRLIRVPVGYNLQTPQDSFHPDLLLSQQVEELRLLGGHQIREPLLEVLKAPAVCEALLVIRELHDMHSSLERKLALPPIKYFNSSIRIGRGEAENRN